MKIQIAKKRKRDYLHCSMRRYCVVAIFIIVVSLGFSDDFGMNDAFAEALSIIKMQPSDVSLRTTVDLDSFRLDIVDSILAHPFSIYDITGNEARAVLDAETPSALYNHVQRYLGIEPELPVFERAEGGNPWSDVREIPPSLRNDMDLVLMVYKMASRLYDEAFSGIDHYQLDTLRKEAVKYLENGSQKLFEERYLGTLEKNFLAEITRERKDERFFTLCSRVDYEKLSYMNSLVLAAALRVYRTALEVGPNVGNHRSLFAPDSMITGDVLYYTETEFGAFAIGGRGTTHYHGNFAFIVDLGGDNYYYGTAGGTGLDGGFSIAIDIGGNDKYISDEYFAFGAGHHGVGILINHGGDNYYSSPAFSQGAGIFGLGLLWDVGGDDFYDVDLFGLGAGFMGTGILIDDEGNDVYSSSMFSQGFGYVNGFGILVDRQGDDKYIVRGGSADIHKYSGYSLSLSQGFGYGHRPDYSGGIGILADGGGNDIFVADIFAQGAAYWLGLGILYNAGGDNSYTAYQFAQGSATHVATAALIDMEGKNTFVSNSLSQGCGHNLALGALFSMGHDDDCYIVWDSSQGAGNANGIGLFFEEGGNDSYLTKNEYTTQGYGKWRREFGSIGIFIDMQGNDTYSGKGAQNSVWTSGRYGVGIDFGSE